MPLNFNSPRKPVTATTRPGQEQEGTRNVRTVSLPSVIRRLLQLGLVFLTTGIATAVVGPFLGLFLSTAVDAGPVQVTFFLVVASLSGVAASWAVGRVSDRRPMRRTLLITAALAGCAGTALTAY